MNEHIQVQAEIAAQWWVDRMTPIHGDTAQIGGKQGDMVAMLQTMLASSSADKINGADYAAFKQALIDCIVASAAECPDDYWLSFGVDYHPEGELREALERVEKGKEMTHLLPFKHHMTVTPDYVNVKAGYGVAWLDIWTKPE